MALAQAVERFGGLDVLFSNAGISGVIAPITEYPADVFRRVVDVHVMGAFYVLKHGLPRLRDGGSVIINSSVVGLTSDAGISGYATAKHAQVGLMRTAAEGGRLPGHPGELAAPRADRHRVPAGDRGVGDRRAAGRGGPALRGQDPAVPARLRRGNRPMRPVPGVRGQLIHDWRHPGRGRRDARSVLARGSDPPEPLGGPRPGSSITGPWPCWPGGATPDRGGLRPGSSITGPWPCWPGQRPPGSRG